MLDVGNNEEGGGGVLVEKGDGGCDASVYLLSTPLKISGIN
jgi:hypothetical protein